MGKEILNVAPWQRRKWVFWLEIHSSFPEVLIASLHRALKQSLTPTEIDLMRSHNEELSFLRKKQRVFTAKKERHLSSRLVILEKYWTSNIAHKNERGVDT